MDTLQRPVHPQRRVPVAGAGLEAEGAQNEQARRDRREAHYGTVDPL